MEKFKDYDPVFGKHGIDNVCAAGKPGVGVQGLTYTMVSGGAIVFASQGLANMASANYQVLVQNQTDIADPSTVGTKTTTGFVITGPDVDDVLDIVIIGQIAGQKVS
jgi:hypothetical protein